MDKLQIKNSWAISWIRISNTANLMPKKLFAYETHWDVRLDLTNSAERLVECVEKPTKLNRGSLLQHGNTMH